MRFVLHGTIRISDKQLHTIQEFSMNGNASRFVFGSSLIWAAFCVGLYLLNLAIRLEIQPNTDPEITLLYFVYPAAAVLTGVVCRTNSLESTAAAG